MVFRRQYITPGWTRTSSTRLCWVHIPSLCYSCLLCTKLEEILLAECTEFEYAHLQPDFNLCPCCLHYSLCEGSYCGRTVSLTSQDFFCVPRPASPPVRRLLIGTHHLEYGFPSTHSANSVGMAIFFYYLVEMARPYVLAVVSDDHPMFTYLFAETYLMEGLILLYALTIVYGRLYAGMHSALGKASDSVQLTNRLFRGLLHWCLCGTLHDLDRPQTGRLLAQPEFLRLVHTT